MSADILFDIQVEIIKRVPVKSLIRFRSISKQWKSLIHSSQFISDHGANQTQPHHLLIRYEDKYVSIVDDDDSFHQQKFSPITPPAVKLSRVALMDDCSHGLVCLHGYAQDAVVKTRLMVIWNPSIRKYVGIVLPNGVYAVAGFGVCPKTNEPKIVKILRHNWQAEVVIDGFIHWIAYDQITKNARIISFDLTSEEFGEVDLPECLSGPINVCRLCIFKHDESLVVLDYHRDAAGKRVRDVWMMLKNGVPKSSFKKIFTVTIQSSYGAPHYKISGFRKNSQPIVEQDGSRVKELQVYQPNTEHISGLGIYGSAFMVTSYTESLLLLNHSDSIIQ